jgi:hypothetical protein
LRLTGFIASTGYEQWETKKYYQIPFHGMLLSNRGKGTNKQAKRKIKIGIYFALCE